jgi:hypothetical protein
MKTKEKIDELAVCFPEYEVNLETINNEFIVIKRGNLELTLKWANTGWQIISQIDSEYKQEEQIRYCWNCQQDVYCNNGTCTQCWSDEEN